MEVGRKASKHMHPRAAHLLTGTSSPRAAHLLTGTSARMVSIHLWKLLESHPQHSPDSLNRTISLHSTAYDVQG